MKTVQPVFIRIDNLLNGILGFIPLISSAGHFSSPRLTTKYWSLLREELLLPTSSWEVLSQWGNILPPPAMSCCTSQLTHSVVNCLELLWEKLLRIVLPQFLERPHTENKFLQAGQCFTLCLKQFHKHKLRVLVCKHSADPEPWQWLYSERSHHVCEHPLQLLFCLDLCHSWYWSLCDLRQCTHIAYIIEFPQWLWCIPDHIRLIRLCHLLALSSFTLLELILNSRTLQGK